MKTLLKILLVLLLAPLAVALAALHWLDPNDYKPEIIAWVEDATGRRLTLEGDLGLSFLPWLGVEVRKASLAQPPGLGEEPFLRVLEAQVRIKPLPLIQGRVELEEILGRGVSLLLRRDRSGRASWDGWGHQVAATGARVANSPGATPVQGAQPWPEPAQVPPLPAATGQGLTLAGVEILWDDQEAGSRLRLQDLDLSLTHLDPGLPQDLRLAGHLAGLRPGDEGRLVLEARPSLPTDGRTLAPAPFTLRLDDFKFPEGERLTASLSGAVQGDLSSRAYVFSDLALTLGVSGGLFEHGALEVNGQADLAIDYQAQTLALRDLVLASGQLRLQGQASATQLADRPKFEGKLALSPLNPRAWLQRHGLSLPAMADAKAFSQLSLTTDWRWLEGRLDLRGLDLTLDQTRCGGNLAWWSRAKPGQEFDLRADRLDLDAYLPPPAPVDSSPTKTGGIDIPANRHEAVSHASENERLVRDFLPDCHEESGHTPEYERLCGDFHANPPVGEDAMPLPLRLLAARALAASSGSLASSAIGGAGEPADKAAFKAYKAEKAGEAEKAGDDPTTGPHSTTRPSSPAAGPNGSSLARVLGPLNLNGRIRIDQLIFQGLSFGDFDGRLSGREGLISLKEEVKSFYGGTLGGQVMLDGAQMPPLLTLHQQALGLNMGDLLRDLHGEDRLRGVGQIEADLSARGLTKDEMVRTLAGTLGLRIPRGQIQGIDLERAIQRATASLQGGSGPAKAGGPEATEFRDLSGSARLDKGQLTTQDLRVQSGYIQARGRGRIDLLREELDLQFEARVIDPPPGQPLKEIEGIPVPIRLAGSLQFPEWQVDPSPLVRELAKRRLQQELDKGEASPLRQLEQGTGIKGLEQGLKALLGR